MGSSTAEGHRQQQDDDDDRDDESLDQLVYLVVGGQAVVARDGDLHAVGQDLRAQLFETLAHGFRHEHGVLALLLRHGDGDGGMIASREVRIRGDAEAEADIARRFVGPVLRLRHIA